MGKKKTRSTYTSSGSGPTVSRTVSNSVRNDRPSSFRLLNQLRAWEKGKKTMVTIENPDKSQTNKKFIRVEGNHASAFGSWKRSEGNSK
jgi:hypothetical protein